MHTETASGDFVTRAMALFNTEFLPVRDISPSYMNKSRAKIILVRANDHSVPRFVAKVMPKKESGKKKRDQNRELEALRRLCQGKHGVNNLVTAFYAAAETQVGKK